MLSRVSIAFVALFGRVNLLCPDTFGNLFIPRMSIKFNVCFVLGGPGAGKGTVCEKIVQDYGFMHLSAGELLRQACNTAGSTYGEEIERHMKAGTIVPAKVTCGLLHQAMVQGHQSAGCVNYLVDGFPRNEDNRACWETDMGPKTVLKRVLVLECPDDVCVDRCMKRHHGRIDDNEDTLKRRIRQFKEQCLPIIEYYDVRNLVSRIDGNKTKDEVFAQVKDVMLSINL
ncbi:hypothetical protein EG68_07185 [Paragonimus skrjabini miyazakii]|uniref:Uncharacterized protein n=1 Tax=Paragonimus skrjabini miyazakii TaxID=59628 RepID=A0A8S9YLL1_9TREM|nr:hypothetical protein EG68_07185 [Paragonimus skrjabini miyazakii]